MANLALIQGWGISAEVNPPAWSISAEFLAYLLFPLLAPAVLRGRAGAVALGLADHRGGAGGLPGDWRRQPGRGGAGCWTSTTTTACCRCCAAWPGSCWAWWLGGPGRRRRCSGCRRRRHGPGRAPCCCLLGMMLAHASDLLMLSLLPVVVLGMHLGRGWAWRLLTVQPLHGLGVLSYAIYLVHYALLSHLPGDSVPRPVVLAGYLLATLLLAGLGHYGIEMPIRQLVRWAGEAAFGLTARRAAQA